jgi:hypothetical protein
MPLIDECLYDHEIGQLRFGVLLEEGFEFFPLLSFDHFLNLKKEKEIYIYTYFDILKLKIE